MSGRVGRQRERSKGNRLAMGQINRSSQTEPVLIEPRSRRRAEGQLMPRNMVGMRMRHEADLLPTRDIERQAGLREKQTLIPMKHACIVAESPLTI